MKVGENVITLTSESVVHFETKVKLRLAGKWNGWVKGGGGGGEEWRGGGNLVAGEWGEKEGAFGEDCNENCVEEVEVGVWMEGRGTCRWL